MDKLPAEIIIEVDLALVEEPVVGLVMHEVVGQLLVRKTNVPLTGFTVCTTDLVTGVEDEDLGYL
jgi:hypothetical protein